MLVPGLPADRRSNGFLLRRRSRTFPFSSVGAGLAVADFLGARTILEYRAFP